MADSSSIQEHTTQSSLLTIKPHQNLILDLAPFKYDAFMLTIVKCQKYSPLVITMTKVECVLMLILSKAYSSAKYVKEEEKIICKVHGKKHFVLKIRFFSLLGLSYDDSIVSLESISTTQIFEMFCQMGYNDILTTVTKFKKSLLPPKWNCLFTLRFKAFSEQVA